MCLCPFRKVELIAIDQIDKVIVPRLLEELRTKVIPEVIQRLNETNELLDELDKKYVPRIANEHHPSASLSAPVPIPPRH